MEKIAELVNDKKLDGISDLRDESNREGIRVVCWPCTLFPIYHMYIERAEAWLPIIESSTRVRLSILQSRAETGRLPLSLSTLSEPCLFSY